MANLYRYADSNDQNGYFLRGRSNSSGYYNLKTTPAANRLFEQLDYKAGRIQHTEGDSVPGELTWRMYQAGLLKTDHPDSTLNTLPDDRLKDTLGKSNESLSLSENDLNTIQSFIDSYSGSGETNVKKLGNLLDTSTESTSSNTDSNGGFDLSDAIENERRSRRLDAANTSLDKIEHRIAKLEQDDDSSVQIDVDEIVSYPSGPQSFTQIWDSPASITSIWGTELFDTVNYLIRHSTDAVEELQFAVSDYTIFDAPDGIDQAYSDSPKNQPEGAQVDHDYIISLTEGYDPQDVPGDDEFSLYIGEQPLMSHTLDIKDGHIQSWSVEVKQHEWSQTLRLLVYRRASSLITVLTSFFENFEGYSLHSPARDFNELSFEFVVHEYDEETKEGIREVSDHTNTCRVE